jgi:hypothetical protein
VTFVFDHLKVLWHKSDDLCRTDGLGRIHIRDRRHGRPAHRLLRRARVGDTLTKQIRQLVQLLVNDRKLGVGPLKSIRPDICHAVSEVRHSSRLSLSHCVVDGHPQRPAPSSWATARATRATDLRKAPDVPTRFQEHPYSGRRYKLTMRPDDGRVTARFD